SAWMARAPGGTTCSSSGCGAASNTRRFISRPTIASARPALRSAATWTSTTAADRIRALTTPHPIKPTSTRCHSAWQPNPGRCSTYRRGDSVQTTGTTSVSHRCYALMWVYRYIDNTVIIKLLHRFVVFIEFLIEVRDYLVLRFDILLVFYFPTDEPHLLLQNILHAFSAVRYSNSKCGHEHI